MSKNRLESATLQPSSWKVWLLKSLPPARGSSVHVSSWGQLHLHCHKWWLHVQWKQTWPQSPDWRPILWFLEERLGEHLYTSAPKWSNFNSISTDAGESGKHDGQSPFQNGLSRGEYTEGTVCDELWNHSCHSLQLQLSRSSVVKTGCHLVILGVNSSMPKENGESTILCKSKKTATLGKVATQPTRRSKHQVFHHGSCTNLLGQPKQLSSVPTRFQHHSLSPRSNSHVERCLQFSHLVLRPRPSPFPCVPATPGLCRDLVHTQHSHESWTFLCWARCKQWKISQEVSTLFSPFLRVVFCNASSELNFYQ